MTKQLIEYLVARIEEGAVASHHVLQVKDFAELVKVLQTIYLLEPEDIKIHGHDGFFFTSNQTHWEASDYPVETFVEGYEVRRAPSYTNEPFFEILRTRKIEKET